MSTTIDFAVKPHELDNDDSRTAEDVMIEMTIMAERLPHISREDAYDAYESAFYDTVDLVRDYVETPWDERVEDRAFEVMHTFINGYKRNGVENEPAPYRLFSDAIFQTCITRIDPRSIWKIVDLLSNASMNGASNDIQDILLGIITEKISREVVPDHFQEESNAPDYIHLLRIKSLGELEAFYCGQAQFLRERTMIRSQLERYSHIGIPLLQVCADVEMGNIDIDSAFINSASGSEGLTDDLLAYARSSDSLTRERDVQMDEKTRELFQRQKFYDEYFRTVTIPELDSASGRGGFVEREYVRVARDAVAVTGLSNTVEAYRFIDGEVPTTAEEISLDRLSNAEGAYTLTKYANLYDKYILGRIMDETGIDVLAIGLDAQQRLFEFMMTSGQERYDRLVEIVKAKDAADRPIFAEAFLATEFGDDLGEQILQLAEQSDKRPEAFEQLEAVKQILKSVEKLTIKGTFAEVDKELADDIRRGISTRTAEIMFALNQRLEKGKDIDKPIEALAKLQEWSSGVATMLERGIPMKVQETGDTKLFHFIDLETGEKYPGAIELTERGKMPEDATARERYVKEGRGARISISYDEERRDDALSLNGVTRRGAMNGRLDKSTYFVETGRVDPDAEHAEVSFDIGSAHTTGASRGVADVIAEARAIRGGYSGRDAKKLGLGPYTYDIIDQKHGERKVFGGFVRRLGEILSSRQKKHETARRNSGLTKAALQGRNIDSGKIAA